MKILKYLWKNNRLLLIGFSIASLVTLGFLVKFSLSVIYWSNNRDAAIEPWMPIGYIARSYNVERGWLLEQTGLPRGEDRVRLSIEAAAEEAGLTYDEMRRQLLEAIEARRAQ